MKLELRREIFTDESTVGKLFIDGVEECYTLEPAVRTGPKVDGETAIPEGTYPVTLEISPHFGRITPRLHDVPGFEAILIHWGNTNRDTRGCILVGQSVDSQPNTIDTSRREFFDRLMPKLTPHKNDLTITILGSGVQKPVQGVGSASWGSNQPQTSILTGSEA